MKYKNLNSSSKEESSFEIKKRVNFARKIQQNRYKQDKKQALRELKEFLENITKYSFIKSIEKSKLDKDLIDKKILLKYI